MRASLGHTVGVSGVGRVIANARRARMPSAQWCVYHW
jgi:hypothetical protein